MPTTITPFEDVVLTLSVWSPSVEFTRVLGPSPNEIRAERSVGVARTFSPGLGRSIALALV